jgi:hypothetical protein
MLYQFADAVRRNHKLISAAEDYGTGYHGLTKEMMDMANGGILAGAGGGTNPLGGTPEAIATGGTRSTTVNIHLGKVQAAEIIHYTGGIGENVEDASRKMAEQFEKILGIVETAA